MIRRGRPRLYSWDLEARVEQQLPVKVLEALKICGWNAFGVYELVDRLRLAERKKKKSAKGG